MSEPEKKIGRCVVVGGSGAVGMMMVRLLVQEGLHVTVVDVDEAGGDYPEGVRRVSADITSPTSEVLEELSKADCALLAVPERVALASIEVLASGLSDHSLIAHTCSVQGPVTEKLLEMERPFEALGFNPMFGPSLLPEGRAIAVVVVHDGPLAEHLVSILASTKAHIVRLSAEDHDRICAISQSATHAALIAFGLTLTSSGVSIRELAELAPPPCVTLLTLLSRLASGSPEVYWDVQSENPEAAVARMGIAESVARLQKMVGEGDFVAFDESLQAIAAYFDSGLGNFAELGQHVLTNLPTHDVGGFKKS